MRSGPWFSQVPENGVAMLVTMRLSTVTKIVAVLVTFLATLLLVGGDAAAPDPRADRSVAA